LACSKASSIREALLVELVLDASTGSDHWFICYDPVLKLCQLWLADEVFFWAGVEPLAVICQVAEGLEVVQHPYLSLDLVEFDLTLDLFFFDTSVLVPEFPSTVEFVPD
jgi:hypothetical protein